MRSYTAWLFCSGRSARRMRTSTTSMPNACASRSSCSRIFCVSCGRSSRTTWMKDASPSTRRSAEINSVLSREFEVQPRLGHDADRLAQPYHDGLPGLIDGEQRPIADDQGDDGEDGQYAA